MLYRGRIIARRTLRLGASEQCEWTTNPIQTLKGKMCGGTLLLFVITLSKLLSRLNSYHIILYIAYYKVLGLERALGKIDKIGLKKAYRSKSLLLHPDKNPSPEATAAFKLIQDAYERLSNDICAIEYENKLNKEEYNIQDYRNHIKNNIIEKSINVLTHIHYVVSLAASHVYNLGLDVWEMAGELEVDLFGMCITYAYMYCMCSIQITYLLCI